MATALKMGTNFENRLVVNYDQLVNCTPHPVNLYDSEGKKLLITIPKGPTVARVEEALAKKVGVVMLPGEQMISIYEEPRYEEIKGLPANDNTPIIVSMVVAKALQQQKGWKGIVLVPDTFKNVVRSSDGQIIGTKAFNQY